MRKDLKLHYIVGAVIGAAVAELALRYLPLEDAPKLFVSYALGCAAAYAIGWAKEHLWDAKGHGVVDALDLRRTWQGGAAGAFFPVALAAAGFVL